MTLLCVVGQTYHLNLRTTIKLFFLHFRTSNQNIFSRTTPARGAGFWVAARLARFRVVLRPNCFYRSGTPENVLRTWYAKCFFAYHLSEGCWSREACEISTNFDRNIRKNQSFSVVRKKFLAYHPSKGCWILGRREASKKLRTGTLKMFFCEVVLEKSFCVLVRKKRFWRTTQKSEGTKTFFSENGLREVAYLVRMFRDAEYGAPDARSAYAQRSSAERKARA